MDDTFSGTGILNCRVFQGSILELLLFFIYINNFPRSLSESNSCFYTDDMYIFNHGRDINKIKDVLTKNSQQSANRTQD